MTTAADPIWAAAKRPVLDSDWTNDGNAFWLLGKARKAQKRAGWTAEQMTAWSEEAKSSDYDHLLRTIVAWHDESEDDDDDEG